ncbi:PEP-CTERM sorting domain-containing protein [Pelomonas sp. Root1237]|uniref:PEP-CTERM sorting domain-containing protein n=1 Tax=Pelomonas sp. Root1237 TaxID=1736434 RepID=UPI000B2132F1|nr:PEP-CTERM sorting domain-containing protein [Pelomonas sp. Root1237]
MSSPRYFLCLALAGLASSVQAAPRHQDVTGPGGFMSSCAAPSSPGAPRTAGTDFTGGFASGHCTVAYFTGNSSATTSDSYSSGNISNSTWGSVGIGHIHMRSDNNSPNNAFFAVAGSNGGFEDKLTLQWAGHTGQTVYMLVDMSIDGTLAAAGFAGRSQIQVTGYMNTFELSSSNPGYSRGNSDLFATDRQRVAWGVASSPATSRVVDGHWTFSVPVVVGTAFDLGIYARAESGQRSFSAVSGNSNSQLDFSSSVLVQGVTGLLVGGSLVTDGYTLSAASGLDWTTALPVPEPGSALLLAAGLGLLCLRRLRRDCR